MTAFRQGALKVHRAKEHISDLDGVIRWLKSDADKIKTYRDPETGKYIATLESPDLREQIALLVGDAAHSLSSALDYCWNVLARKSVQSGARLTFPMHERRSNLEDTVRKSPVTVSFPEAGPLVLDTIRPYKEPGDGNYVVWAVRGLDNTDKHNLLVPVINITKARDFILSSGEAMMMGGIVTLEGSGRAVLMTSDNPIEVHQHVPPALDVRFAQGQPFEGSLVVETLTDAADAVGKVVELFAQTFPTV